MNKPNWEDAPEWANWLAMDHNGSWYWHDEQPWLDTANEDWISGGSCRSWEPYWSKNSYPTYYSARDTLEKRP